MTLSKAALLEAINAAVKTGAYPCGLHEWVPGWEQRNYKKPGDAVRPIQEHLESLDSVDSVLDLFLGWTDENNAYWGAYLLITAALLWSSSPLSRLQV